MDNLNNSWLFDLDITQNLFGLMFCLKDSSKLKKQKSQLMKQVREVYKVNYDSEVVHKALQRKK